MYLGFRDFRTESPVVLRTDLQRWNAVLERAFTDMLAATATRWRVVVVVGATGNAAHGDIIKAGRTQTASVMLPRSSPGSGGRAVRVFRIGAFAVTAVAATGDNINGEATYVQSLVGWVEFVDDGSGTWMANA